MWCIFKHCHQVSCILGLCDWLYILSVVVWIGFLLMMHFCFACYMLMHPHALFFSYFVPKKLFCYVSSFVISFSFSNMAPRKFVPLKILISRCGSSFSSSLPFVPIRDRFRDLKSQKDFDENFCERAIHSECHVILFDFPDTLLPGVFSSRGWESLYKKPLRCPNVFIQ